MNITLLTTGGTIASTSTGDGARPTKTGDELVASVPGLAKNATLTVESVTQVASYQIDAETLETIGSRVQTLADDDRVDAIILTHGTDTLEETAYYLDVTVRPSKPVILTGAQRTPDDYSPDGPANLLTAVDAATAFARREHGGTFVAFNDEIHAARTVTKTHTTKLETFRSTPAGPVATASRREVVIHRPPMSETLPLPARSLGATVYVIKSGSCTSGGLIEMLLETDVDGFVVEGTGMGNVGLAVFDGVCRALETEIPVVITSRCQSGRTAPVYGGRGGGHTLNQRGAIFAGDLPTQKARIRLSLCCSAYHDPQMIRDAFMA